MRLILPALLASVLLALSGIAANAILLRAPAAVVQPSGDLIYKQGTFTLRLTSEACPVAEMRDPLEEEGIPPARIYVATQGDKRTAGCYALSMDNEVLTLSVGGDAGVIPLEWFRQDAGV